MGTELRSTLVNTHHTTSIKGRICEIPVGNYTLLNDREGTQFFRYNLKNKADENVSLLADTVKFILLTLLTFSFFTSISIGAWFLLNK